MLVLVWEEMKRKFWFRHMEVDRVRATTNVSSRLITPLTDEDEAIDNVDG